MKNSPSILIVDDDAMVRDITLEFLTSFGFKNVVSFPDGQQALKFLQDPNHHIDLIISDWEMPEMTGIDLLKAIRLNPLRKSIKFLMLTSQRSQERLKITRAAHWKVDAYIVKPYRGNVLRDKIDELLQDQLDPQSHAG